MNGGQRVTWSLLSAFGNTPLAKAVVFTPIVAGYVYYSSEYLQKQWGFQDALWLYWSLIALSLGQLLYIARAPNPIKRHGGNSPAFIDEGLRTWSERTFEFYAVEYVAALLKLPELLKQNAKSRLETPQTDFESAISKFRDPERGPDPYRSERWLLSAAYRLKPIRPDIVNRRINTDNLLEMLEHVAGRPLTEGEIDDAKIAVRFMNTKPDVSDWKKELLENTYRQAEVENRLSLMLVAFFYLAGTAYFAWNTFQTLLTIMNVTIASATQL